MQINTEHIVAMKTIKNLAQNNAIPKDEANKAIVILSDLMEDLLKKIGYKEV